MPRPATLDQKQFDSRLQQIRAAVPLMRAPRGGWIRSLRTLLGMRLQDLASRMDVSPQAVAQLEAREEAGTITLNALRQAAQALDAELFVVVVPRHGTQESLDRRAEELARLFVGQVHHSMRLEDQATGDAEWRARVAEVKAALLRTPTRLWTMPDGNPRAGGSNPD